VLDNAPDGIREIDHTGDLGLALEGPDLATLFERAATGLFYVLCDPGTVRPREAESVHVEARDRAGLLVAWLSALNRRHVGARRVFARATVDAITPPAEAPEAADGEGAEAGWHLAATAHGEPIDRDRHVVHTEVKAVTYHALTVEEADDGTWHAQVIFDL
jgi:tRNA nucleotidyltransferase (CCA-adding enzyme)